MSFSRPLSDLPPSEMFCRSWFDALFWFHERATDVIIASEQLIQKEYATIKKGIDEWDEKNPNHSYSGFEIHENDLFSASKLEEDLPSALFIQQYGQFERLFDILCGEAGKLFSTTRKPDELRDKGIYRSRKFVTEVLAVNLDSLNEQWHLLQQYSKVRGVLAHGAIEMPNTKLKEVLHLVKSGMVSPQGAITIKIDDIRKFIRLAYDYLGSVIQLIGDRKKSIA